MWKNEYLRNVKVSKWDNRTIEVVTLCSRQGHRWNTQESKTLRGEMWNYDAYVCGKLAIVLSTSM